MTEKLFYEDSHMASFTATVESCFAEGETVQIVLDRTAFFPEGGGQYADGGSLFVAASQGEEEIPVLDVQEENGVIYHVTRKAVEPGTKVRGEIDWSARFDRMQQHSGEHIVSGLVHGRFNYNNVGFHLGHEDSTMDFDGEISDQELSEIEIKANEAVAKDLEVEVSYPTKEELKTLVYRSKIEIEGQTRIVTIPGYDVCACCAPHVSHTGEIGLIRLTEVQRYKQGVRIHLLCGFRALMDYREKSGEVSKVSVSLCAKENEISQAVENLKTDRDTQEAEKNDLLKELLSVKAEQAEEQDGAVCLFEKDLSGEAPRMLMNLILQEGAKLCAVFSPGAEEGTFRYVIGSPSYNMRELSQDLNLTFQGKGGGKPEMIQGSLKGKEEEIKAWIYQKGKELSE